MIVQVGALVLEASDVMPEAARQPVDAMRQLARFGLDQPTDAELHQVERAAFGDSVAADLRRLDMRVRFAVHAQLVHGWGVMREPASILVRGTARRRGRRGRR